MVVYAHIYKYKNIPTYINPTLQVLWYNGRMKLECTFPEENVKWCLHHPVVRVMYMIEYEPTTMSVRCSGAEIWLARGFWGVARVLWVVARWLLGCSGWLLGGC